MSTHTSRAPIDLAPRRDARPSVALGLALLAVPGSTVAWELPAGGFWIGLPLAIAAIFLGVRARRAGAGPKRATAAIVIAGACVAMMTVWTAVSIADAQDPAVKTLTVLDVEKGGTFAHVRGTKGAPRQSNLAGDIITFTNPLADTSGDRIGKLSVACVTTTGARRFQKSLMTCHGVMELADGTLTLQGNVAPAGDTRVAVTGGTGAYAGARGEAINRDSETELTYRLD